MCYTNQKGNTLPRNLHLTRAYPHGKILVLAGPKPNERGGSGVSETQFSGLVKNVGHMFDFIFELGLFEFIYKVMGSTRRLENIDE